MLVLQKSISHHSRLTGKTCFIGDCTDTNTIYTLFGDIPVAVSLGSSQKVPNFAETENILNIG